MLDPELKKLHKEIMNSPEYKKQVEQLALSNLEVSIAQQAAAAAMSPEAWTRAASQEAINRARDLANHAAESLMRDMVETELRSIGEKIARAIEQGKRPREIAKTLEEVKSLDRNRAARYEKIKDYLENSDLNDEQLEKRLEREYEKLRRERQRAIADNEGIDAHGTARYQEAERKNYKFKTWVTSQNERVCPICTGNEAQGLIPIQQAFQNGSMYQPAHPNCRCAVNYVPDNPRAIALEEKSNLRRQENALKAKEEAARNDARAKR